MKAVLFDFWGTLVENGVFPSPVRQVRRMLRLKDIPFPEFITRFEHILMTKPYDSLKEAFQEAAKEFGVNPKPYEYENMIGMWNKNMLLAKPYPETIEVLLSLKEKGIKVGLISNTDNFSVKQVLDKFKLPELFDDINLSFESGMLKSDPDFFMLSIKRLGVPKSEVLMVGDSLESDIQGAANAGIKAVLIDRRDTREYPEKISNLYELNKHL